MEKFDVERCVVDVLFDKEVSLMYLINRSVLCMKDKLLVIIVFIFIVRFSLGVEVIYVVNKIVDLGLNLLDVKKGKRGEFEEF